MKGKITIVLFSLVLVFGILAASCDNGAFPKQDDKFDSTYVAYKSTGTDLPLLSGGKPIRLKSVDVYDALQKKIVYSTNSGLSWSEPVAAKVLGKVAMKTTYTSDDDIALAKKYAGLPILIANPDIPTGAAEYVVLTGDDD